MGWVPISPSPHLPISPHSLLPIPYSLFPTPYSLFPIPRPQDQHRPVSQLSVLATVLTMEKSGFIGVSFRTTNKLTLFPITPTVISILLVNKKRR
ncbi:MULTISPECIES: hypothetical protein [unclassified Moorena]|uniref:hypothetical protein n=1 Tax=unclassified Moorena TaxID=2683338 RepID=UPI0013C8ABE4|nr:MULTISPECIES: hypothetical protein [unclassified Moorena]NEO20248.1 hypothetical protein [Moorena sp. SIO4A5]NEP22697.1 hypothetical protein [Moorena sp. SIO3I6]NEQ56340.1 hypothetical protein [Moorena sp. SIO4A1]